MTKVSTESVVDAPREQVFAYVDDYRNTPNLMLGMSRFEPVTEQSQGLGSTFDAVMKFGPKAIETQLKCTEWVEGEKIVMSSVKGFDVQTTWSFADAGEGKTAVTIEFDYKLPGGLAGKAIGAVLGPGIGQAVKHTDEALKKAITEQG